jgi:hypothetical protein
MCQQSDHRDLQRVTFNPRNMPERAADLLATVVWRRNLLLPLSVLLAYPSAIYPQIVTNQAIIERPVVHNLPKDQSTCVMLSVTSGYLGYFTDSEAMRVDRYKSGGLSKNTDVSSEKLAADIDKQLRRKDVVGAFRDHKLSLAPNCEDDKTSKRLAHLYVGVTIGVHRICLNDPNNQSRRGCGYEIEMKRFYCASSGCRALTGFPQLIYHDEVGKAAISETVEDIRVRRIIIDAILR